MANIVIPIAGMATGAVIVVTVGRLIKHWVDRHYDRTGGGEDVRAELEQRSAQLAAGLERLAELDQRLLDLEERVDFTERVLTRERGRDRLPGQGA